MQVCYLTHMHTTTKEHTMQSKYPGGNPAFEHTDCSRCGGSGRYSFNMIDGSMCYGCRGAGYQLTKRGRAAQQLYVQLMSKPLAELVPGDVIRVQGYKGFHELAAVGRLELRPDPKSSTGMWPYIEGTDERAGSMSLGGNYDAGLYAYRTTNGIGASGYSGDTMVRVAQTAEQRKAKQAQALAYQATLTKAGTPRKRAAKVPA